jgi:hypothetical protein
LRHFFGGGWILAYHLDGDIGSVKARFRCEGVRGKVGKQEESSKNARRRKDLK